MFCNQCMRKLPKRSTLLSIVFFKTFFTVSICSAPLFCKRDPTFPVDFHLLFGIYIFRFLLVSPFLFLFSPWGLEVFLFSFLL